MKCFPIVTNKWYLFLSSVFIATPPLLWLYIDNWNETRFSSLLVSLTIIIATCLLISITYYLFTRNIPKSAVITSLLSLFIFSYGEMTHLLYKYPTLINLLHIRAEKAIILLFLATFIALTVASKKKFVNYSMFATYLLIVSVFLIIPPIIKLIQSEVKRVHPVALPNIDMKNNSKISANSPDIYYVIIERYASFDTLQQRFNFKSNLLQTLKKEDFYIATDSMPNYPHTSLSLASSLNLSYLDKLSREYNKLKGDETHLHHLIENSALFMFLKEHDYKLHHLGDNWQGTEINRNANFSHNYYSPFGAFTRQFLEITFFDYLFKKYIYTTKTKIEWFKVQKKESEIFKINKLREIVKSKQKKMVFAHILVTHEPYVLSGNGYPITDVQIVNIPHEKRYVDSVTYGNTVIRQIIKTVKQNRRPYIMIIQADEGPYTYALRELVDSKDFSWSKACPDDVKTHMSILNAYYFPNKKDYKYLYPSISPVNSFRLVLTKYFYQGLPILQDKHYLNDSPDNLYQFKDITDFLK